MEIKTKYNIGDKVIFDGNRTGEIVGFEILATMKDPDYKEPCYPQFKSNIYMRYQIKPIFPKDRLCGDMREESTLRLIKT